MAFHDSVDKLYQTHNHNGNFLALIELLSKFDPVLQEHIQRTLNDEIHDHYLGKTIQNEILSVIARRMRSTIVNCIKEAKYFAAILDCTPDQSNQEQMLLTYQTEQQEPLQEFMNI